MDIDKTVAVDAFTLVDNSSASVVQFGDRKSSKLKVRSLNIEQNKSSFTSGEAYFHNYSVFNQKPYDFTDQLLPTPIIKHIPSSFSIKLPKPHHDIHVHHINVISSSDASNIQIGHDETLYAFTTGKSLIQYL